MISDEMKHFNLCYLEKTSRTLVQQTLKIDLKSKGVYMVSIVKQPLSFFFLRFYKVKYMNFYE